MRKEWKFLGVEFYRIGSVEKLSFFGMTIYRRAGACCELFGCQWMEKQ